MSDEQFDRRKDWQPSPRPEWLRRVNEEGEILNARSVVPLDEASLCAEAKRNTGLDDFGDDEWIPHFRVLIDAIENEAKLHFFGRIMTRSDLIMFLEARLRIADWYKSHPETEQQEIKEPIFIIGFGRSGTTILHEVLSQDPQFRAVRRWEAMFPVPPPEESTYHTDARIQKADALITQTDRVTPEWKTMHKMGGELPVEDIEFLYLTFLSEVYNFAYQIPSYAKHFAQQDLRYTFNWHKRFLKLLQSRYMRSHWLMKVPTFLPNLRLLMETYPDARIILTHRDPIVSADSVVNVQGTIYWWRTDDPWSGGMISDWVMADERARTWDEVIELIETGIIPRAQLSNFIYADFMKDPQAAVRRIYTDLNLTLDTAALEAMSAYLSDKPQGKFGAHRYASASSADVIAREREYYRRYQDYFGIPDEI